MNTKIEIDTETKMVEDNGWVKAGAYHSAMFARTPEGVKGCPCGRSQHSMEAAIRDLVLRTNSESGTKFTTDMLVVRKHRE